MSVGNLSETPRRREVIAAIAGTLVAGCMEMEENGQEQDGAATDVSDGGGGSGSAPTESETPDRITLPPDEIGDGWDEIDDTNRMADHFSAYIADRGEFKERFDISLWSCENVDCTGIELRETHESDEDIHATDVDIGETAFGWWNGGWTTSVQTIGHKYEFRVEHRPIITTELIEEYDRNELSEVVGSQETRLEKAVTAAEAQVQWLGRFVGPD